MYCLQYTKSDELLTPPVIKLAAEDVKKFLPDGVKNFLPTHVKNSLPHDVKKFLPRHVKNSLPCGCKITLPRTLSCVPSILLSVAVLPEKVSCPIPAAYSGVGMLPATSGHFVPKSGSLRCFPSRGIPFRTVILFSRCCPSMNYPKSTRKKCNPRNFARIAF